jgi:hypothetical protein
MNYSFSVKFKIFYHYPLTTKELKLRENLCEDFHTILKTIVTDLTNIKYLERCEPSISSLDEKKQLRMDFCSMLNQDETQSCYLIFDQNKSHGEYFSLEELKVICQRIKQELEENYLPYEIQEPLLFIHIDDIV